MSAIAILGASGGLGQAVARSVGAERPVFLGYRSNRAAAQSVADALMAGGGKAGLAQVDIRDLRSVEAFLAQAAAFDDGLAGVASVTGAPFPMSALTDATEKEFRDVIEIELFGSFNMLKAAVPMLEAVGGGPIVIFLTTAVLRTMDYDGLNSVPKAAIGMMLRHVARESGPKNIRVNAIAPGVIDAGRTDVVHELPPLVQKVVADCLAATPSPRLGKPSEVGALAAFLLSDNAAYINGQTIGLDGGYSA